MSYHTYSIIIKADKEIAELKKSLSEHFKFSNVRELFTPFKGIICQTSENFKEYPFDRFPDSFFKSQDEVEEYFSDTETRLLDFSRKNDDLKIAFVEMDCFGGKCASNGYLMINGNKVFEQDVHHSGHMLLLREVDDKFNSWFFYPFTRSFFSDKGGISGEISNFSLPAIWMSFNVELGSDPEFEINVSENELQILNENKFEFYLMNLGRERIKAMGRLFSNDEENIKFIKKLLIGNFEGIEHYFEIDDFETGQKHLIANFSEERYNQLASVSYRANAFNERPFQYSDDTNSTYSNQNENVEHKNEGFLGIFLKSFSENKILLTYKAFPFPMCIPPNATTTFLSRCVSRQTQPQLSAIPKPMCPRQHTMSYGETHRKSIHFCLTFMQHITNYAIHQFPDVSPAETTTT